jgi:hypothetical protein
MSSARRMRWLAHLPTHRRPVAKTLVHRRDMSMFDERCMKRVTAGATVGAAVGGAVGALTQVSTHTHLCSHRATSPAPLLRSLHRRGVWHIRGVSLQGARPVESAVHREDHYQQRRRVRPLPRSGQPVAMRTEEMTSGTEPQLCGFCIQRPLCWARPCPAACRSAKQALGIRCRRAVRIQTEKED